MLRTRARGYSELVTAVGNMGAVNVGSVLSLKGEWKHDRKFGRQFSVLEYEETLPATVFGIEKYLRSWLIKGVGSKFAWRIVNTYGADTLTIIDENPDKLGHWLQDSGHDSAENGLKEMKNERHIKDYCTAVFLSRFYG